jgi:hypothetical protein
MNTCEISYDGYGTKTITKHNFLRYALRYIYIYIFLLPHCTVDNLSCGSEISYSMQTHQVAVLIELYSVSFLYHSCAEILIWDVQTNGESTRFSGLAHSEVDIHHT